MFELANPWGLTALLAIPAIVGVHYFQNRFPPLNVAGLHLWGVPSAASSAGRKLDRLPFSRSLLWECLTILLLALLLAGPRLASDRERIHRIVVLDHSLSMLARDSAGKPAYERAVDIIKNRAANDPPQTRYTLFTTGVRPTLIAGPAVEWPLAEAELVKWQPTSAHHSYEPAWELAAELAGAGGEYLFVTDHPPETPAAAQAAGREWISVGQALGNVSIAAANWQRATGSAEGAGAINTVQARFANWSVDETTIRIALAVGRIDVETRGFAVDRLIHESETQIGAKDSIPWELPLTDAFTWNDDAALRLTISTPSTTAAGTAIVSDALAVDSEVLLLAPPTRFVSIANRVTDGEAQAALDRVLNLLPAVVRSTAQDAAILFGDTTQLPEAGEATWWFGVGPADRSSDAIAASRTLAGPYLLDQRHPLLAGVTWDGIISAGVSPFALPHTPLVSAGDSVLLAELQTSRGAGYVLNLELGQSNLVASPDWPILISNLVEERRRLLPGFTRSNYRLGETVTYRSPKSETAPKPDVADGVSGAGPGTFTLTGPAGTRAIPKARVIELGKCDQAGIYRLQNGIEPLGEFAINVFDDSESNLLALGPVDYSAAGRSASSRPAVVQSDDGQVSRWVWMMLAAVLGLLLLNWFPTARGVKS